MRRLLAPVALLCLTLGAVAFAAGPRAGAVYRGRTTQGLGVSLRVSSTARTVRAFAIAWDAPCRLRGRADHGSSLIRSLPIYRDRRFGNRGRFESSAGRGLVASVRESLRGRFTPGGRAFGSFTAFVVFRRNGRYVTRCRTGRVRWSARPPRQAPSP